MPKILKTDKSELNKLYSVKKLGSYEIARLLHCSQSLIMKRLREYGIKTRGIQEAKALTKPRFIRNDFSGDMTEKAYLIGFRLGDLHVLKTHPNSPTIQVRTNSTKEEQLLLFEKLFSQYGYVKRSPKDTSGATSIRTYLNDSFDFLLKKEDGIEDWIRDRYIVPFLAGYADAEGTFCICGGDGVFSIKSQDKSILFTLCEELNRTGVLCKSPTLFRAAGSVDYRGVKCNKNAYIFTIYRKDSLLKLVELIRPFLKHGKRVKDMLLVKQNIDDRNKKYNFKEDRRWHKTYSRTHERP